MSSAEIEVVGPGETALITELYNQVFRPPKTADFFSRRFEGRVGALMLVAQLDGKPVGFATGFELKPSTYFAWLCGVLQDARRLGVAAQLMEALRDWAAQHNYLTIRFECYSKHRPMLHLAIKAGYDVVGIRWDCDGHDNLVIFEKDLSEQAYSAEDS